MALEIKQNELTFLCAVNWRLHISDTVFQQWTDISFKYTPKYPPAYDGPSHLVAKHSATWTDIILQLKPELDNFEDISSLTADSPISAEFNELYGLRVQVERPQMSSI
jgi:hypothetical protein